MIEIAKQDLVNTEFIIEEGILKCDICGKHFSHFSRLNAHKQEMNHSSQLANQGKIKYEMDIDNMFASQMVVVDRAIEVSTEEIVTEEIGIDHEEVIEMKKEQIFTPLKLTETPQVPLLHRSTDSLTLGQNDSGIEPGTYVFCKFCQAYVVKDFILKHQRDVHYGDYKWKGVKPEQDSSPKDTNQQDQLACEECGKPFTSKRAMYGHKREFHSGIVQKHKCPQCGRDFARRSNLKAHQDSLHFGKTFPCSECKRHFTNPSAMRSHRKNIHYKRGM